MRALLCIMHARRMAEPLASFRALRCDKAWLTGYTMRELVDVHAEVVELTPEFDAYVMCSDDCVVSQDAWDAVVALLAEGRPAVTGHVPLVYGSPLVNLTRSPLRGDLPRGDAYEWMARAEVLAHPEDPVPTGFMGMGLTGMPRELWRRFPAGCFTYLNARGHSSDFHLCARLRDAGVPMVAPKAGWIEHLKLARGMRRGSDWRGEALGEQRLFIGEVSPHVLLECEGEAPVVLPVSTPERVTVSSMPQRAPHTLYVRDGAGVRRRIRAGDVIPPGYVPEEPLAAAAPPAELVRIERDKALRRAAEAAEADAAAATPAGAGVAPPGPPADLAALTVPELRDLATARGLTLPAAARKAELVAALEGGSPGA